MRSLHTLVLGLVVAVAGSTGSARGQTIFANLDAPLAAKGIVFQPAKQMPRHGTLVSLVLNNGDKVTGHVVRADLNANSIFLRTKRGAAPVAFAGNNVKQLLVAWQTGPKGQMQVVEPEIFTQMGINGTHRSVAYSSSVISPAERELLSQMERAKNDVMALAYRTEQRESAIAQEMLLQEERVRTQRLINITMQNENSVNYPYPPATPDAAGVLTLVNRKGVITLLPQLIAPVVGIIDRLPPVDPQALASAQAAWARLQGMAVYEDGRLVAVIAK